MSVPDLGYVHLYNAGRPGLPLLLLLHGTGGDETDMLPVAAHLLPGAALLSPRGNVTENGMNRFFARKAHGIYDMEDLARRTRELADFVRAARTAHGADNLPTYAVGYSNGANIALNLLLTQPELLAGAVLLRPMLPYRPEERPSLAGKPVFIASGTRDAMVPPEQPRTLAAILTECGADVRIHWEDTGHPLTDRDIAAAHGWLQAAVAKGSLGNIA